MTGDELRAALRIGQKLYDVYDHLIHIRGFVDDQVVYRYWNQRKRDWVYKCDWLEMFDPKYDFYTKAKHRA